MKLNEHAFADAIEARLLEQGGDLGSKIDCGGQADVEALPRPVLPIFLEFVRNSDWTQKQIEESGSGEIPFNSSVGAMKDVPLPVPQYPSRS
jgi:hypothetical protein